MELIINVENVYGKSEGKNALLSEIPNYVDMVTKLAEGKKIVTLTGAGPVWLYLIIAHVLHGKVALLQYDSPVTGHVTIHDHRS